MAAPVQLPARRRAAGRRAGWRSRRRSSPRGRRSAGARRGRAQTTMAKGSESQGVVLRATASQRRRGTHASPAATGPGRYEPEHQEEQQESEPEERGVHRQARDELSRGRVEERVDREATGRRLGTAEERRGGRGRRRARARTVPHAAPKRTSRPTTASRTPPLEQPRPRDERPRPQPPHVGLEREVEEPQQRGEQEREARAPGDRRARRRVGHVVDEQGPARPRPGREPRASRNAPRRSPRPRRMLRLARTAPPTSRACTRTQKACIRRAGRGCGTTCSRSARVQGFTTWNHTGRPR